MKNLLSSFLMVVKAGMLLVLSGCVAFATLPLMTVFGGAQLAISGTQFQKQIRKADYRKAFDSPFKKSWEASLQAVKDLHFEITAGGTNREVNGGLIEAQAQGQKVRVAFYKLTDRITEVGIWAQHNEALARLIAQKIEEGQCQIK